MIIHLFKLSPETGQFISLAIFWVKCITMLTSPNCQGRFVQYWYFQRIRQLQHQVFVYIAIRSEANQGIIAFFKSVIQ